MAPSRLFIILAVFVIVSGDFQHEVETENKAKKALASEKEQKTRSASPGRERTSLRQLTSILNRTKEEVHKAGEGRGKGKLNKIRQLNRKNNAQNDHNHMMNDNEGAIAINQKTIADNDTNSLAEKMKVLRREGPTYEAINKYTYVPQVTGVYCNFENSTANGTVIDMCLWQWNSTVTTHGLGFKVITSADLVTMNETSRGPRFAGPSTDADRNVEGEATKNIFLQLIFPVNFSDLQILGFFNIILYNIEQVGCI